MTISKPPLYQTHEIRLAEQFAYSKLGLNENTLMERAGEGAFLAFRDHFPTVRHIAIFCGGGNNGGDGYVFARYAKQDGYQVIVYQTHDLEKLPPFAHQAALRAIEAGVDIEEMGSPLAKGVELIVDALLGIGLKDKPKGVIALAINQINESNLPVLALDTPSGLNVDTGFAWDPCVRASLTITFIAHKIGLTTLDGPDYSGNIVINDLQFKAKNITPPAYLLGTSCLNNLLPFRLKNSHKGMYGHVLIIGGGRGMLGAAYLAANAALRVGAGLVTIATKPIHANRVLPSLPEAILFGVEDSHEIEPLLEQATVCILGPGLSEDEWAVSLFKKVIASELPLVIDASGLRILARHLQEDDKWILTPHPGEAAALLHCTAQEIQNDRLKSAIEIQQCYGGNVVLKGAGTIIYTDEAEGYVCPAGNPGMASAGMGDVLSGVIGGLVAQNLSLADAAKLGVWVHAVAGDKASQIGGERGLLASDLMPFLRKEVNSLGYKRVV